MERFHTSVAKAFQHGHLLSMKQKEYREWVLAFLQMLFDADRKTGDITVKALFEDPNALMETQIIAQEAAIMAGLEELHYFCESQKIHLSPDVKDGDRVKPGRLVARLKGSVRNLLETERIRLDLLGRMSGIATLTHHLSKKAHDVPLSATRKTFWGLLDKKAVFVGGGLTHRLGLWQAVLIKDNHLAALRNFDVDDPFPEAISVADSSLGKRKAAFIEIEVEKVEDAQEVIRIFQNMKPKYTLALLLDNFLPEEIQEILKTLKKRKLRKKILVEVSGGITEKNLLKYAATQPDLVSLGILTHSPRTVDFSEQLVVETRAETRG